MEVQKIFSKFCSILQSGPIESHSSAKLFSRTKRMRFFNRSKKFKILKNGREQALKCPQKWPSLNRPNAHDRLCTFDVQKF